MFLAVLFGMLLLALAIAMGLVIVRAIFPAQISNVPLVVSESGHYEVAGKIVQCSHCSGTQFAANEILLNTWLLSLLRIDWLDSSATALTCEQCGKLTWFSQESADDKS